MLVYLCMQGKKGSSIPLLRQPGNQIHYKLVHFYAVCLFVGWLVGVDLFDLLCKPCRFTIQQCYSTHNSGIMYHGLTAFYSHILNDIKASAPLSVPAPLSALAKIREKRLQPYRFWAVVYVYVCVFSMSQIETKINGSYRMAQIKCLHSIIKRNDTRTLYFKFH